MMRLPTVAPNESGRAIVICTAADVARCQLSHKSAVQELAHLACTLYENQKEMINSGYLMSTHGWGLGRWCLEMVEQYCAVVNQGRVKVSQAVVLMEVETAAVEMTKPTQANSEITR